jgi:hypothetical protein
MPLTIQNLFATIPLLSEVKTVHFFSMVLR